MILDDFYQKWVEFGIDCYKKKSDDFAKEVKLPGGKRHIQRYRRILGKKRNEVMDGTKINKRLKIKFEARYPIKINIRKYDCFFIEHTKAEYFEYCRKKLKLSKKSKCVHSPLLPLNLKVQKRWVVPEKNKKRT